MPTRIIACSFSLIAFALASVIGLLAGNPALTILQSALAAGFAGFLLGLLIGRIALHVIDDDIQQYQQHHPIPDEHEALAAEESRPDPKQDAETPTDAKAIDPSPGTRSAA